MYLGAERFEDRGLSVTEPYFYHRHLYQWSCVSFRQVGDRSERLEITCYILFSEAWKGVSGEEISDVRTFYRNFLYYLWSHVTLRQVGELGVIGKQTLHPFIFFHILFYLLCSGFPRACQPQKPPWRSPLRSLAARSPAPLLTRVAQIVSRETPGRNLMLVIFPGQNIKLLWASFPPPFHHIPSSPSLTHIHTHSLPLSLSDYFLLFFVPFLHSAYPSLSYSFSPFLNSFLPPSLPFFSAFPLLFFCFLPLFLSSRPLPFLLLTPL